MASSLKIWPIPQNRKRNWQLQSPNVSTTPIKAMRCRQCLSHSFVQLKGKHCQKPNCLNGVVDTFGQNLHFWSSKRYIFQKLIFMLSTIAQFLTSMILNCKSLASDFFFRRHKNLEHVQHDQRVGGVSQTAKIERPRDPSIESSSSVDTRGTRSSATLTCNGTVWTVNLVLNKISLKEGRNKIHYFPNFIRQR
jgi:hypothetical protein